MTIEYNQQLCEATIVCQQNVSKAIDLPSSLPTIVGVIDKHGDAIIGFVLARIGDQQKMTLCRVDSIYYSFDNQKKVETVENILHRNGNAHY